MKREYLIRRYNHNYFTGWVVSAKRRGKRFTRYFSDHPRGRLEALHAARAFRGKLVSKLPRPTKIKRSYVRNTTGVIGVARVKECTGRGKITVRYVASWPKPNGKRGKASFSESSKSGFSETILTLITLLRMNGLNASSVFMAFGIRRKWGQRK